MLISAAVLAFLSMLISLFVEKQSGLLRQAKIAVSFRALLLGRTYSKLLVSVVALGGPRYCILYCTVTLASAGLVVQPAAAVWTRIWSDAPAAYACEMEPLSLAAAEMVRFTGVVPSVRRTTALVVHPAGAVLACT